MQKLAAAVLTLVLVAATAHADTGDSSSDRSEVVATTLSIAGTLAGPALIVGATACCDGPSATTPYYRDFWPMMGAGVAAMTIGPSLGEWYAGKAWSRGLAVRVVGGGVLAIGASMFVQNVFSDGNGADAGALLVLAGGGAIVAGTGLDIWDAHTAVREHNARRKLAVVPTANRGLAVVGTF